MSLVAFSSHAISAYIPKVATSEYARESVRVLFHLYRLLSMRYRVKKSPEKMRTDELTSMAMRSATMSPYSAMYARTRGFVSSKPSSGCDSA